MIYRCLILHSKQHQNNCRGTQKWQLQKKNRMVSSRSIPLRASFFFDQVDRAFRETARINMHHLPVTGFLRDLLIEGTYHIQGLCNKAYVLGNIPAKYGLVWYSSSILGSWNSHWPRGFYPPCLPECHGKRSPSGRTSSPSSWRRYLPGDYDQDWNWDEEKIVKPVR